MQEIKAICNRVIVINKAEIVADYPDISKINLFNEENRHFEVEFAEAVKPESLQKLENITAVHPLSEKRFTIIASTDIREIIFDFAVKSNNKILTINSVERSMEDVFRELTK